MASGDAFCSSHATSPFVSASATVLGRQAIIPVPSTTTARNPRYAALIIGEDTRLSRALLGHAGRGQPRALLQIEAYGQDDHRYARVLEAALDHEGRFVVQRPRD